MVEDGQQRAVSSREKTTSETTTFQAYTKHNVSSWSQAKIGPRSRKKGGNDKVENCDFCGKDGHNRNGCFNDVGYPE